MANRKEVLSSFEKASFSAKDSFGQLTKSFKSSKDCLVNIPRRNVRRDPYVLNLSVLEKGFSDLLQNSEELAEHLDNSLKSLCESLKQKLNDSDEKDINAIASKYTGMMLLSYFEALNNIYTPASEKLLSLGEQSEVNPLIEDGEQDLVAHWFIAAKTNSSLKQVGHLSRSDLQHLVRASANDGLSVGVQDAISSKVSQCLNDYILELRMLSLSLEVLGGFYLHPHRIEQILSKCCSDWEARSAGAAPVASRQEQQAQIFRDIPHSSLRIDKMSFQPLVENENRDNHIKAKKTALHNLVLKVTKDKCEDKQTLEDFTTLLLHHCCFSVSQPPSKVAVQLFFGIADLIHVMLCQDGNLDNFTEVQLLSGGIVEITSSSSWSLCVDQRLESLSPSLSDKVELGTVDVQYIEQLEFSKFFDKLPQIPPRIKVSLRPSSVPDSLSTGHYGYGGNMLSGLHHPQHSREWEGDAAEELSEEYNDDVGSFHRSKALRRRGVTPKSGGKPSVTGSDNTLQSSKESDKSSSSESLHSKDTDTTATTVLIQPGADDGHNPPDLCNVLIPGGLTTRALRDHTNKKPSRKMNTEETGTMRTAIRRHKKDDQRSGVGDATENAIDLLSNYPNLGDGGSQSSGYYSQNSSFRSESGSFWGRPYNQSPVTSAINRGSRDRQSGSQSPRGTPISSAGPVGPYSYNWPYQPTKASSSASLVLHAGGGGQDSDTGSYYSPSPWSMIDENESMDEQPMAGSVTSLAAERFKENMATRKAINHPPPIGMNRSRSLDDIRKQTMSPAINNTWDSNTSLAAIGEKNFRAFPDPSDPRSRGQAHGKDYRRSSSRDSSIDRPKGPPHPEGQTMHPHGPPKYMHPREYPYDRPPQQYSDYPPSGPIGPIGPHGPGPMGPMYGPRGPHPMAPGPQTGPGPQGGSGPMYYGPPPPMQDTRWEQHQFRPVHGRYNQGSPYSMTPSPRPHATPPTTPPPPHKDMYPHPLPHRPPMPYHQRGPPMPYHQRGPPMREGAGMGPMFHHEGQHYVGPMPPRASPGPPPPPSVHHPHPGPYREL